MRKYAGNKGLVKIIKGLATNPFFPLSYGYKSLLL
jgi:hypothetical protein